MHLLTGQRDLLGQVGGRDETAGHRRVAQMNRQVLTNLDRMMTGSRQTMHQAISTGRPMRSDNSQHLVAAAHKRTSQTRRRAVAALRRMADGNSAISFGSMAREAGVSRSWLYAQPDLRAEIEQLRARNQQRP
jgi:hypothetical protein